MFFACLRKELLLNIKSMRFVLTALLFVVGMYTCSVVRTNVFNQSAADYRIARAEWKRIQHEACWAYESQWLGAMAFKPPNPMSIVAGGLDNEIDRSWRFSYNYWIGEHSPTIGRRRFDSPLFRRFLNLDMVLLTALVGSLLALVLAFDSVCGEREQGTLRLQMAGPLPRDTVLVAKLCAAVLTLFVPLVAGWVTGLA
jgi:ABC-2 type transport system permease protein